MNCKNHAERAGTLAIDLPSLGIQTHLCDECKAALTGSLSQYKGKREAWDHNSYDFQRIGNDTYTRGSGGYFVTEHPVDPREL